MSFWAIVPIKPLRLGKSRLAPMLGAMERAQLNRALLERTISTLIQSSAVGEVLVVSRDPSALALARELGARSLQEDGAPSLNAALRQAAIVAQVHAPTGVLVIPADLPLLSTADVTDLLAKAGDPPVVVIAPDRHRRGTNALLLSPPNLIAYDFGGNSFARHCEHARRAGARLEVVELPSLGLDLDLPEDLALIRSMQHSVL